VSASKYFGTRDRISSRASCFRLERRSRLAQIIGFIIYIPADGRRIFAIAPRHLSLSLSLSLLIHADFFAREIIAPRARVLVFSRRNFVAAAAAEKTQNRDTARPLRKYLPLGEVTRRARVWKQRARRKQRSVEITAKAIFSLPVHYASSPTFTSSLPGRVSLNEKRIIRGNVRRLVLNFSFLVKNSVRIWSGCTFVAGNRMQSAMQLIRTNYWRQGGCSTRVTQGPVRLRYRNKLPGRKPHLVPGYFLRPVLLLRPRADIYICRNIKRFLLLLSGGARTRLTARSRCYPVLLSRS